MSEVDQQVDAIARAPSKQTLMEVCLLLELCFAFPDKPQAHGLVQRLGTAAHRLVVDGFLERIVVASPEYLYPSSLMLRAACQSAHAGREIALLQGLIDGGLVGRTDLPPLTMALAASHFGHCGVAIWAPTHSIGEIEALIDKRLLRRRFDSYDVMALLMAHHLAGQTDVAGRAAFKLAAVVCVLSTRMRQLAWLPIMMLLIEDDVRGAPLIDAARSVLSTHLVPGELLSASGSPGHPDELVRSTSHGLRIRNTLAYLMAIEA